MKLRFRPEALEDLEAIYDYLARHNPSAAAAPVRMLRETCSFIRDHPMVGRARPELRADLRSFPTKRYVILYRLLADAVEIVNVIHGSRDIDGMFSD